MRNVSATIRRRWKRAIVASVVLAAPMAYIAIRSKMLLNRTAELIAVSNRFSRDYHVGDPKQKALLYAALGDSTAAGVGASRVEETYPYLVAQKLASRGRYVRVVNVAQSGARIDDLASQLAVLSKKALVPEVVTMSVGANDATHRTEASHFESTYESVLRILSVDTGVKECLIASTPDMSFAPAIQPIYGNIAGERAREQNDWLRSRRSVYPMRIVELYDEGKLDNNSDPGLYASDRFHPSAKGYAIWAGLFIKQL